MTTDQAIWLAIETNPEDSTVKLVYADFLDENGDPRGPGYRAMGHCGKWPGFTSLSEQGFWWTHERGRHWDEAHRILPDKWFAKLKVDGKSSLFAPDHGLRDLKTVTFRELMDAAALAFARLTPSQQRKYLPKEVIV